MTYYQLVCKTCDIRFEPLRATRPGELAFPDYDEVREQVGESNADRLEDFHRTHRGHETAEIDEDDDPTTLLSRNRAHSRAQAQKGVA